MPKASKASRTVSGQFCSPLSNKLRGHGRGGESCYTKEQLLHIIAEYNKKYSSRISTRGTKEKLWLSIENRMSQCNNEWCWMEKLDLDGTTHKEATHPRSAFRPERPVGKNQWLNTLDIKRVLKQYEDIYPDFVFLGPVPMDFCNLAGNEVCNINIARARSSGKIKIGIVFNTDPSTEPGKHWISMFIDITDNNPANQEISYFDSYGIAPMLPEVKALIVNLQKQNPKIKLKLNCNGNFCTRAVRHQQNNTECGMYSINFIVMRLTGKPWEQLVLHQRWSDEQMTELRKTFFRPTSGSQHRY
jgi:hypothetical protein